MKIKTQGKTYELNGMTSAIGFLAVISIIELVIGFKNKNVHLIRDFITSTLMVISMLVSFKADDFSKKGRNG